LTANLFNGKFDNMNTQQGSEPQSTLVGMRLSKLTKHIGVGRPPRFREPDEMLKAFEIYMEWCEKNWYFRHELHKVGDYVGTITPVPLTKRPFSILGFCCAIGVGEPWYRRFRADHQDDKEFSAVFEYVESVCKMDQLDGAMVGSYKENLVARLHGLHDRIDVTANNQLPDQQYDLKNLTDEQLRALAAIQSASGTSSAPS
jgi:hypothetical protein